MKKLILSLLLMLVCVMASAQTYVYSVANDGYTNIRSANSTSARIIGELRNGGGYAVYMHTSGNWYKVNYNGIVGYVHKSQVRMTNGGYSSSQPTVRKVYSAAPDGYTNVRRGPGTNYGIIGEIHNGGAGITYISTSGNWYKVNYYGTTGYVHKSQVRIR